LTVVADETIERRNGRRIQAKGRYRDAVRSTKGTVVKCYGLRNYSGIPLGLIGFQQISQRIIQGG
jgi:hypothetical protein